MTAKKSATTVRLEAYVAKIKDTLAFPPAGIIADAATALHDAIEASGDEETVQGMIDTYFAERPHLMKPKAMLIPKAERDAAFGERPSLAAQGALVKTYGRDAAEAAAEKYGTKLGTIKPGRDPEDSAKSLTLEAARKVVSEADAAAKKTESTNPFSPHFKGDKLKTIEGIIRRMGSKHVQQLAKAAGTDIAGRPLKKRA